MGSARRERRIHQRAEREEKVRKDREAFARRQRTKKVINYAVLTVVILGVALAVYRFAAPETDPEKEALARCLTDKGVIMYGTDWCPHCQEQKQRFGQAFKLVNYVNCDLSPEACTLAGVTGYPTWVFPLGQTLAGEQELATLSSVAGCAYGP